MNFQEYKPNISSIGYALFLAVNATALWGGVFPFLPMSIQTESFRTAFFFAQSATFALSFFASTIGVYFFPGPTRRILVFAAGVPYFFGWCFLIGAIYFKDFSLPLAVAGGAALGIGSAGFYMAWQRLFASQKPIEGNRDLIVGTLLAPLFYAAFYLIPIAVTVFLIPFVLMPLFALCVLLTSRRANFDQPMFDDIPLRRPQVYRQTMRDYWRSALCIGAFALSCGTMVSIAIESPVAGVTLNVLSMVGMFIAAGALMLLWQYKPLRINVSLVFRVLFPFVISAFLLMPLVGDVAVGPLSIMLNALYNCAIVLMMIQCAQAARDRKINPVFIYGFFGGVVYALHDMGYMLGLLADTLVIFGIQPLVGIALLSIYMLGIMYFIGQGGMRQAISPNRTRAENIELIPTAATRAQRYRPTSEPDDLGTTSRCFDRTSKQIKLVKKHYKLSEREAEVVELVVRGNTVPHIAELLTVSENTVRTYNKRIYSKLDIHKKQELLDLLNSFDPRSYDDKAKG